MEARLIASFRAVGGPGRPFLERARALIARFTALGGVHVGWDVMKITFAFEATKFPAVLEAVINGGPETEGEEPPWAVGLAQGDLRPVNDDGSPLLSSGLLWWGPPIVAASALAGLARPGELLCAQTVPALRSGDIITSGLRIVRDGTLRVRGARIDKRQPWRHQAGENLTRMSEPRLVRSHLPAVSVEPGGIVILRADPGAGGTRFLTELAARAPRSLVITPVGSGVEPFGALRRALGRSNECASNPLLLELSVPLEKLLAGSGSSLEMASKLITAFLWPKPSTASSALIIDDAKWVDPATLEACVRAVRKGSGIGLIARLDATSSLPSVLAALPKVSEHELVALSREGSEDIAVGCVGGALDALARGRWARLGGGNPLAIVEAITEGIASGALTWTGHLATPRSRAAGRGEIRPAAKWIRQRANAEKTSVRAVLSLLAVVGGEAKVSLLTRVLEKASLRIDAAQTVAYLEKARWVVRLHDGYVAFPSRTHRDALFTTLEGDAKRKLHLAVARTLEESEGVFGRVEAAWHAAQAGEGTKASAALLEGARATADAHLDASTTQLIAFARRADPSCEEAALEVLADALERSSTRRSAPVSSHPATTPSARPFAPSVAGAVPNSQAPRADADRASVPSAWHADAASAAAAPEPPSAALDEPDSMVEHAVIVPPGQLSQPPSASGTQIAHRLGELAKDALLAADNVALERWVDGLRAAGESPAFTERMLAMSRLGRGEIGDALRVLRRTRAQLEQGDHRRRCQTSLALGVALSVAGRPEEALLEALDALARARQIEDERGSKACLAFLAKLYTSVSREDDAERLRVESL